MTEKRFVHYEHKGAEYILEDPNIHLDFIEMLGDCLDEKEIVDRLNELYDENEQLKQTVSDWSGSYDELFEDVKRLEKENEQIKHLIKEAYNNERTAIGKSVLKQLLEAIQ